MQYGKGDEKEPGKALRMDRTGAELTWLTARNPGCLTAVRLGQGTLWCFSFLSLLSRLSQEAHAASHGCDKPTVFREFLAESLFPQSCLTPCPPFTAPPSPLPVDYIGKKLDVP